MLESGEGDVVNAAWQQGHGEYSVIIDGGNAFGGATGGDRVHGLRHRIHFETET